MATINRLVLDISHHNTVSSWSQIKAAGIVGIIHKATEGTSYVDEEYADRREQALAAGLKWGAYHFANNRDVADQVDHFLGVVGIDDETLYALDWEDEPNGNTMTLEQARDFLLIMDELVGKNRCALYSGNTVKDQLGDTVDEFLGAHPLWLAHYSSSPTWQRSWETYWLHQYSDGVNGPGPHGCPGCGGAVDTNSYQGTPDELRAEWAGADLLPAPDQVTVTITIAAPPGVNVVVRTEESS